MTDTVSSSSSPAAAAGAAGRSGQSTGSVGLARSLRQRSTQQTAANHHTPLRRQSSLADRIGSSASTKNVVVVGGSYGGVYHTGVHAVYVRSFADVYFSFFFATGMHAASVLAQKLPPSHRVILIERNSHFNRA